MSFRCTKDKINLLLLHLTPTRQRCNRQQQINQRRHATFFLNEHQFSTNDIANICQKKLHHNIKEKKSSGDKERDYFYHGM